MNDWKPQIKEKLLPSTKRDETHFEDFNKIKHVLNTNRNFMS